MYFGVNMQQVSDVTMELNFLFPGSAFVYTSNLHLEHNVMYRCACLPLHDWTNKYSSSTIFTGLTNNTDTKKIHCVYMERKGERKEKNRSYIGKKNGGKGEWDMREGGGGREKGRQGGGGRERERERERESERATIKSLATQFYPQ